MEYEIEEHCEKEKLPLSDRCRFEVRTKPCIRPMKVQERHLVITQNFFSYVCENEYAYVKKLDNTFT